MKPRYFNRSMLIALTLGLSIAQISNQSAQAQPAETAPTPASELAAPPATQPASEEAAAEQAMNDLLGSRQAAPIIEPVSQRPVQYPGLTPGASAASIDIDPAVLGIAPGEDPPPLRREGEFINNRRGRLIRAAEGGHLLFVFESDTQSTPELPMVFQACQILETMENEVQRRGDTTVFKISGQIHTYRGANYLLPTMMKIAEANGNLTN